MVRRLRNLECCCETKRFGGLVGLRDGEGVLGSRTGASIDTDSDGAAWSCGGGIRLHVAEESKCVRSS